MIELGDDFGNREDNLLVANWEIEIVNDESKIPDELTEDAFSGNHIGKWQNYDDMNSNITFSDKEMIFSYEGTIIERIDYIFSDDCVLPEPINMENAPDLAQYIYIQSSDSCWQINIDPNQRSLSIYDASGENILNHIR